MYHKRRSLSRSDWNRRINGKYPGKTQKRGMVIRVNPNVNLLGDGMVSTQDLEKEVEYILKNNILFIPEEFTIPFLSDQLALNQLFYEISPAQTSMNFDENNLLEWAIRHVRPFVGLDPNYWRILVSLNYINFYCKSNVHPFGDIRCLISYSNVPFINQSIDIAIIDMQTMDHSADSNNYAQFFAMDSQTLKYFTVETDVNDPGLIHTSHTEIVNRPFQPLSRSTFGRIDLVSSDAHSIGKTGVLTFDVASGNNFDGITIELGMIFQLEYVRPN